MFAGFGLPAAAADRVPNDTYFPDLWFLKQIGAPEAWNYSLGFEGVPIAIIDSGVDIDHPDLKDNIWRNMDEIAGNGTDDDRNGYIDDVYGWDFVDNDNDPRPAYGPGFSKLGVSHGTINAGVAAAKGDNGKGVVGVTWQSTIMAIRALDSDGTGEGSSIIRAIEYAVANGAKVINLSFTGETDSDILAIALRRAYDSGVFVVAAAGNAPDDGQAVDLDKAPLDPICLDRNSSENYIYGVTATDDTDRRAPFANYGSACVDISAPGTRILATQFYKPGDNDFGMPYGGYYNGTSLAAPVVAGAVALIRALDSSLTPKQITNILTQTAVNIDALNPGYFGKLGRGRIDIAAAVRLVLESRRPVAPAQPGGTTVSLLPTGSSGRVYVAAAGPGRQPEVRLFNPDGVFIRSFNAFPASFRGGVNLAIGNFDGSSHQTIVAGAGPGGGPHIRVFNINTQAIGGFFAYDQAFRGGVSVAAGDVDGDGKDEIIAGAGPGGGPHVRIFKADGRVIGGFFAFDQAFRGGVSVAAGDVDGDGKEDIAAVSGSGMSTTVRVFNFKGQMLAEFRPFGTNFRSGGRISVTDYDNDGRVELAVTPPAPGVVKPAIFESNGERSTVVTWNGTALINYPAAGKTPILPLLFDGAKGAASTITVSDLGRQTQFQAFEAAFLGGVRVGVIE